MTDEKRRPRPAAQYGPTSATVASNVQRLRKRRDLSIYELSGRLKKSGRPIAPSAVAKIERRERQVTVDDLMALASVLGVSPTALLLPVNVEPDEQVEITGSSPVDAFTAWNWIEGGGPLHLPPRDAGGVALYHAVTEYNLFGRPHWLVEQEGEERDEVNRLRTEQYEREGLPEGPSASSKGRVRPKRKGGD